MSPRRRQPEAQLQHATLCASLSYYPESGDFVWNVANRNGMKQPGSLTGSVNGEGYLQISINKRQYKAHRLAWFYTFGEWPPFEIDHINGDRADNRIVNLRLATHSQNQANGKRRRTNACGLKGVHFHLGTGKWRATIAKDGKLYHLGLFASRADAHAAYCSKAQILFGEFWRAQ